MGASSTVYGQADLAFNTPVTMTAGNPAHVGTTVTLSFSVKNIGTLKAALSHTCFYISPTANDTANGIKLGSISLESLDPNATSGNIEFSFVIPYSVGNSMTYYVLTYLNATGSVWELFTTNNLFSNNLVVDNSPWAAQNIPYPIIFIHGLNSDNTTWDTFISTIQGYYGWTFGGRMDFCLNQDGNLATSDTSQGPSCDYHDYTGTGTSILTAGDLYTINFDVDIYGTPHDINFESNQSAIVKQGLAVRDAIKHVLDATHRDKVVLVGHSMGGLAARQYLQNHTMYQADGHHHVARLETIGTPHGGSNSTDFGLLIDEESEAVRDLRAHYLFSPSDGVFLFGGVENLANMQDEAVSYFNNADVNCDGIVAGATIYGLNNKSYPLNLTYSSLVGTNQLLPNSGLEFGDGVVSARSANINNYLPVNADVFNVPWDLSLDVWHTKLTKQIQPILKGLDEPNDNFNGRAYEIKVGTWNFALLTQQSGGLLKDVDCYSVSVTSDGILDLSVGGIQTTDFTIAVRNAANQVVYYEASNGKGFIRHQIPVVAGNYLIRFTGTPPSNYYPYFFKTSFVNTPSLTCNGTSDYTASSGSFDDGSGTANYSDDVDCKWLIHPSGATSIALNFSTFNVIDPGDKVFVYDGATTAAPVLLQATGTTIPTAVTSTAGTMLVRFTSNSNVNSAGWSANYTCTSVPTYCNGKTTLTTASGAFSDGSGTTNYGNLSDCSWLIAPQGATSIQLTFTKFNTDSINDYLEVFDGVDENAPLIGTWSGNTLPSIINSTGGFLFLRFISDDSITAEGWNAYYTSSASSDQTGITGYQYWYDNDYSDSVSIPVMLQKTLELNTVFPTTLLSVGLHSLHYRFVDNDGKWSSVVSRFFYKPNDQFLQPNNLSEYEYWFDNDYVGKMEFDTITSGMLMLNDSISSGNLSVGLHTFHIRFKDRNGQWSSMSSRYFYKSKEKILGSNQIVRYEYWFDNDYNNTTTVQLLPSSTFLLNDSIIANNLSYGLHSLHFRFYDVNGEISSVLSKYVFVDKVGSLTSPTLTQWRFWFDANNAAMTYRQFVLQSSFEEIFDTLYSSVLTPGQHVVHMQFQDNNSKWSSVLTDTFIVAITTPLNELDLPSKIGLYPNPTHAEFTVTVPAYSGSTHIFIFNAQGALMKEDGFDTVEYGINRHEQFDAASGLYFVHIIQGDKTFIQKLVVN